MGNLVTYCIRFIHAMDSLRQHSDWYGSLGGYMAQLILTLALIFVVYFIGYFTGCHHVVSDIKRMTRELEQEANNELSKMQHQGQGD